VCDADANLVARAQDGDAQAFVEVIRRGQGPFYVGPSVDEGCRRAVAEGHRSDKTIVLPPAQ
jgi:hypothetical protein